MMMTPRTRATHAAWAAYPHAGHVAVSGHRPKGKRGAFVATVTVDGRVMATASHRQWRLAYKGLEIELAKSWCF